MTQHGARRLAALAIALGAAVGLASCAGADAGAEAAGDPVTGGTLTFLESTDYGAQGGFAVQNTAWGPSMVNPQLVDRLTYQNPETKQIEPWLAESWDVSEDGLVYTFHLRDGVTFSNGDPVDAAAVQAVYEQRAFGDEAKEVPPLQFFKSVQSVDAPDAGTVVVTLSAPDNSFLQATSIYVAGIVAQETLDLAFDGQSQVENTVGSGPFTVAEATPSTVTLAAREDYDWAPPSAGHQGRAYLDEVVFQSVLEDSSRTGSILAGQADIARSVQPVDEQTLRDSGVDVESFTVLGETNHLLLRQDNPILADEAVRRALLVGTDRAEITEAVLSESYRPATGFLTESDPYYLDLAEELAYDPDAAERILDEAGWTVGDDGIREKDGQRLALEGWIGNLYQSSGPVLELVKSQWEEIGVEFDLTEPDGATLWAAMSQPNAAIFQAQMSQADPGILRTTHYSGVRTNYSSQIDDPGLDALLDAQAVAATDEERLEAVQAVQQYLYDHAIYVPLYEEAQVFAVGKDVHGFATDPVARVSLYDTWKSQ